MDYKKKYLKYKLKYLNARKTLKDGNLDCALGSRETHEQKMDKYKKLFPWGRWDISAWCWSGLDHCKKEEKRFKEYQRPV